MSKVVIGVLMLIGGVFLASYAAIELSNEWYSFPITLLSVLTCVAGYFIGAWGLIEKL